MKDRINYYISLPLIFFAFFLETAFFPFLLRNSFQVPLVFIVLLASVFLSSSSDFIYIAFLFGFLFDIYFGTNFGIFTVSVVLSAVFASFCKDKFLKEESFGKVAGLSVAVALFFNLLYVCLLSFVFGSGENFSPAFIWKKMFFDSFYAAILVYPAMRFISKGKE